MLARKFPWPGWLPPPPPWPDTATVGAAPGWAVRSTTRRSSSAWAAQGCLCPGMFGSGAQGLDAVGQIVCQRAQQPHFLLIEGVRLRGVDQQHAQHAAGAGQRNAHHRSVAALEGFFPPGRAVVRGHVLKDRGPTRADRGSSGTAAPFRVGPGDVDRPQITLFVAGLGHRTDGFAFVLFRVADPAQPIARDLDDDAANLLQQ